MKTGQKQKASETLLEKQILSFLKANATPVYNLPMLESVVSSFLEHIRNNEVHLIETGKCSSPFIESPFFDQFSFLLFPIRSDKSISDWRFDKFLTLRRKLFPCTVKLLELLLNRISRKGPTSFLDDCFLIVRSNLTNGDFRELLLLEVAGFKEPRSYGKKRLIVGGLFDIFYLCGFISFELGYATMAPCYNRCVTFYRRKKNITDDEPLFLSFSEMTPALSKEDLKSITDLFLKQHMTEESFWGADRSHLHPSNKKQDEQDKAVSYYRRLSILLRKVSCLSERKFENCGEFFIAPFDKFAHGINPIDSSYKSPVSLKAPIAGSDQSQISPMKGHQEDAGSPKYLSAFKRDFTVSPDYSSAKYKNHIFTFPRANSATRDIFRALCSAYFQGNPEVDLRPIINRSGVASRSVSQIFRNVNDWKKIIKAGRRRGTYRLTLPDPR